MNIETYHKLLASQNWEDFNQAYNGGLVSRGTEDVRLNGCAWPAYYLYKFFHRPSGNHMATFKSMAGFGGFTRIDKKATEQ